MQGRITEVTDIEKILEEIIDRIVEGDIEMREIVAMKGLVIGIDPEIEILQGALIAADPDQDPEYVQIGTE